MTQGELHGRKRPGRAAGDWQPLDSETVQKLNERIRLVLRGGIFREVAAQVAEPRRGDDPDTAPQEAGREAQALIESAAGAVDHQQGGPLPLDRILDDAEASVDEFTPARHSSPCRSEGAVEGRRRIASPKQP
ncbi:MAG: hypothetical protein K0Q60_2777 [Microvirga sp.]|nr:hypothetical protein [Microvirga sp.]